MSNLTKSILPGDPGDQQHADGRPTVASRVHSHFMTQWMLGSVTYASRPRPSVLAPSPPFAAGGVTTNRANSRSATP